MRRFHWLHVVCLLAPIAVVVLLLAGVERGLWLLVWLLCPLAMLLMMRHMGGHSGPSTDDAPLSLARHPEVTPAASGTQPHDAMPDQDPR
jgi:hypothetical protein